MFSPVQLHRSKPELSHLLAESGGVSSFSTLCKLCPWFFFTSAERKGHGCERKNQHVPATSVTCDTYEILWLRVEKALTPGLLKADDVNTTHGCRLDDFTNTAMHGIDL